MFSNKENINILTSLLAAHGIKRAVVCPGSRNAPIVHNLNECKDITCYPVTDERSAGFYALGMSLACGEPVAVCVTSGTALLNLAPAVAEATYRHHGLIVISADRPSAWIGQLDGQTMPQVGALRGFVCKSVSLPEPHDDIERWHCNRLVNEALLAVKTRGRSSVHINVPVSEPLFFFNTPELSHERVIKAVPQTLDVAAFSDIIGCRLKHAERPMLVLGQLNAPQAGIEHSLEIIGHSMVVLSEPLSSGRRCLADFAVSSVIGLDGYAPDFVLYVGDTVVSKRLKRFLRNAGCMESWLVSEDGEVHDPFMNVTGVIEGNPVTAINELATLLKDSCLHDVERSDYVALWNKRMSAIASLIDAYEPPYSQMAVVREFELSLEDMDYSFHVHYANSSAVRLGCMFSEHYVWCNRGINGIEGSLSTAAGHSAVTTDIVFCVIGDLSFFYDQNALWNTCLGGNLRIILLNNGCGGIFYGIRGLSESPAFERYVTAAHLTTARGICVQNDVGYLSARNAEELHVSLATLMTAGTHRPMLLEVFTDPETDERAVAELASYVRNMTAG